MMSQEKKLKCRTIQENSVMLLKKKKNVACIIVY